MVGRTSLVRCARRRRDESEYRGVRKAASDDPKHPARQYRTVRKPHLEDAQPKACSGSAAGSKAKKRGSNLDIVGQPRPRAQAEVRGDQHSTAQFRIRAAGRVDHEATQRDKSWENDESSATRSVVGHA